MLALTLAVSSVLVAGCEPKREANLILISLDTTRRDHMSLYGYERATTPNIDRLAAGGAILENAIAQMTITNPSHASMFTGLYPHSHKVGENTRRLADERITLTEVLAEAGFRTGGFVSGHPLKKEITGINQGFEVYDSEIRRRRDGASTVDRAVAWLHERAADERFFLFVHLYDAHGPYRPKEEFRREFRSSEPGPHLAFIPKYQKLRDDQGNVVTTVNEYIDRYDSLIRFQDHLVAKLVAEIDLDRTVVAIVADHGETLDDRPEALNLNHGTSVFDEQIAIPLVVRAPGMASGRYQQVVETVDLMPTLLEILEVPVPEGLTFEGESFASVLAGGPQDRRRLAFASTRVRKGLYPDRPYELRVHEFIHTVRSRQWKLISYPGTEGIHLQLFDLEADPRELNDLADERPTIRDRMWALLLDWQQVADEEPAPELSPEDVQQLKALGYG